ncbi:hypothetical protein [Streptomyces sp. NPDC007205]|uniref:hypothetical protein n=1 Tax=Streptomyces sp. NPDC007205 TaxID=3154316 RepID=UPI0033CDEAE0
MPMAAPRTSDPATATATVSVNTSNATPAVSTGRPSRTRGPNRSYSRPVTSAATVSTAGTDPVAIR